MLTTFSRFILGSLTPYKRVVQKELYSGNDLQLQLLFLGTQLQLIPGAPLILFFKLSAQKIYKQYITPRSNRIRGPNAETTILLHPILFVARSVHALSNPKPQFSSVNFPPTDVWVSSFHMTLEFELYQIHISHVASRYVFVFILFYLHLIKPP